MLKNLSPEVEAFIEDVQETADKHDVLIDLSEKRYVIMPDSTIKSNGYFAEDPILAVACGQSVKRWLHTLVHESCHMDQWIEQVPEWNATTFNGVDALDILELWFEGMIEIKTKYLNSYIRAAREVELDCEKRAVEKIKKYNLPLKIDEYIQKANSYIWFYTAMRWSRKWYTIGHEPYNTKSLWSKMPTHFLDNYDIMPKNIRAEYLKLLGSTKQQ